jgi:predicted amidophosphoribosyltransferase
MKTVLFVLLLILGELAYLVVCFVVAAFSTTWNQDNTSTDTNLIPCPDCGRHVSRLAKSCPNCGRPFSAEGQAGGA